MKLTKLAVGLLATLSMSSPELATAGSPAPGPSTILNSVEYNIVPAAYRLKPGCRSIQCRPRPAGYRPGYRLWHRRDYYGRFVAGVALGAIIVTAANRAPRPPADNLCWFWSNNIRTHGYWDYCY